MTDHRRDLNLALRARRDPASRFGRAAALLLRKKRAELNNAHAMVSFTFDDIPDSAFHEGASILEAENCRGTFYISGGLCGGRSGPWSFIDRSCVSKLINAGHEIGCHTFSHADIQTLTPGQLLREFEQNRAWFESVDPRVRLDNIAYPYGSVGWTQKPTAARHFSSCRGVRHGINAGKVDFAQLKAVQLYDNMLDEARLDELLGETTSTGGWLIFYTHDVTPSPTPHGCSPELLRAAIRKAKAAGLAVVSVRDALAAAGHLSQVHD